MGLVNKQLLFGFSEENCLKMEEMHKKVSEYSQINGYGQNTKKAKRQKKY